MDVKGLNRDFSRKLNVKEIFLTSYFLLLTWDNNSNFKYLIKGLKKFFMQFKPIIELNKEFQFCLSAFATPAFINGDMRMRTAFDSLPWQHINYLMVYFIILLLYLIFYFSILDDFICTFQFVHSWRDFDVLFLKNSIKL